MKAWKTREGTLDAGFRIVMAEVEKAKEMGCMVTSISDDNILDILRKEPCVTINQLLDEGYDVYDVVSSKYENFKDFIQVSWKQAKEGRRGERKTIPVDEADPELAAMFSACNKFEEMFKNPDVAFKSFMDKVIGCDKCDCDNGSDCDGDRNECDGCNCDNESHCG